MRLLTFTIGVMLCVLGVEISQSISHGWTVFWWVTVFAWCFICVIAGIVGLVGRLLSRKSPAPFGGLAPRPAGKPGPGDE